MTKHYHIRLSVIDKQSFVEVGAYTEISKAQQAKDKALMSIRAEGELKYSIREVSGGVVIHKTKPEGILDRIDQILQIVECEDEKCLCPHCKGDVVRGGFLNLTRICPRCDLVL